MGADAAAAREATGVGLGTWGSAIISSLSGAREEVSSEIRPVSSMRESGEMSVVATRSVRLRAAAAAESSELDKLSIG